MNTVETEYQQTMYLSTVLLNNLVVHCLKFVSLVSAFIQLFADVLSKNKTLETLNLESNFLTGVGIMVSSLLALVIQKLINATP